MVSSFILPPSSFASRVDSLPALQSSGLQRSGLIYLLASMLPKTKYARSGDVRIAYQITGDGPFDVVWAPGTMSHLDLDWEIPRRALFFERFSRFCRLIRFDKRGTGLSDRPVKMATLEERADDIRAVMDAVGIERANIFGASE